MFIDHFSRGFLKYVNRILGTAMILRFVAIFLRPDVAGPQKYMLGFVMGVYLLIAGFICLVRPHII